MFFVFLAPPTTDPPDIPIPTSQPTTSQPTTSQPQTTPTTAQDTTFTPYSHNTTESLAHHNEGAESVVLTTVWIDSSDYDQTPICTVIMLVFGILIVIAAAVLCFINYRRSLRRLRHRIQMLESHYSQYSTNKAGPLGEQNGLLYAINEPSPRQLNQQSIMNQPQPVLSVIPLRDDHLSRHQ